MIARMLSSLVPGFTNASLENPAVSLTDPRVGEWLSGGIETDTGIKVTPHIALQVAAVFQPVSIISGDVASMTLNCHRRLKDDDRSIDNEHPAQYLVSMCPNEEMHAFDFWRRLVAHALLWGNGYAYIRRESRVGEPLELVNLLPDRTKPARASDGRLYYLTEVDGRLESLFKEEVLHLRGLSLDNSLGAYLVEVARNSFGLALAAEGFASKFFANGSQMAGILEVPPAMTPKAVDNLEEGFRKRTSGKDNWFKTVVLRDGAKFHSVTVEPQKSQLHELREDQVRDSARFFNLPPFKLGLEDSVSYNSAEMAQRIYWSGCLRHWTTPLAYECQLKLLTEKQRRKDTHYFEHNTSTLLEADYKTMNEVLEIQRRNEVINANEWRRKINLNKRTDPGGEEYINPNTRAKEAPKTGSEGETEPMEPAKTNEKAKAKLADDINCMARRVCLNAKQQAKDESKFVDWLDGVAASNQRVFDEKLWSTVDWVAESLKVDAKPLFCAVSGRFFSDFQQKMDVKSSSSGFQNAVAAACDEFEKAIAKDIETLVFGGE